MIKKLIIKLCGDLKRHVIAIADTLPPSEELVDSFLAPKNGDLYGSIINKVFTAPKAFERYPQWRTLNK